MDDNIQPIDRSSSLRRNFSKSSHKGLEGNKPSRQRSLVRPERERNDPNSRLYHYRQRAANEQDTNLAPSSTGNQPLRTTSMRRNDMPTLERRPTARQNLLRRGKSILGREEKIDHVDAAIDYDNENKKGKWCDPWLTYCQIITCCIPKQLLRCAGKQNYILSRC